MDHVAGVGLIDAQPECDGGANAALRDEANERVSYDVWLRSYLL